MIKGKTSTGFAFQVDPEIIKDYEYLELAATATSNGVMFPLLVEYTLGKEQKNRLIEHLKTKKGRALTEDVSTEFTEILEALKEKDEDVKN